MSRLIAFVALFALVGVSVAYTIQPTDDLSLAEVGTHPAPTQRECKDCTKRLLTTRHYCIDPDMDPKARCYKPEKVKKGKTPTVQCTKEVIINWNDCKTKITLTGKKTITELTGETVQNNVAKVGQGLKKTAANIKKWTTGVFAKFGKKIDDVVVAGRNAWKNREELITDRLKVKNLQSKWRKRDVVNVLKIFDISEDLESYIDAAHSFESLSPDTKLIALYEMVKREAGVVKVEKTAFRTLYMLGATSLNYINHKVTARLLTWRARSMLLESAKFETLLQNYNEADSETKEKAAFNKQWTEQNQNALENHYADVELVMNEFHTSEQELYSLIDRFLVSTIALQLHAVEKGFITQPKVDKMFKSVSTEITNKLKTMTHPKGSGLCTNLHLAFRMLMERLDEHSAKNQELVDKAEKGLEVASGFISSAAGIAASAASIGASYGAAAPAAPLIAGIASGATSVVTTLISKSITGILKLAVAKKIQNRSFRRILLQAGNGIILSKGKPIETNCTGKVSELLDTWYRMSFDQTDRSDAIKVIERFDEQMNKLKTDKMTATNAFFWGMLNAVKETADAGKEAMGDIDKTISGMSTDSKLDEILHKKAGFFF